MIIGSPNDPLLQIIGLLKPQAVFWHVVEARKAWTIGFRPADIVVFGQVMEGVSSIERDDGICFDLEAGDFMLSVAPPNWTIAAFGGGIPVDSEAVVKDPGLGLSSAHTSQVTRFVVGSLEFAATNRDLISTLMLPSVHVRGDEIAATRLAALLATFGDKAMADRLGRLLVLGRLLKLILIEALPYCSASLGDGQSGLLAGLADSIIGRGLRMMHSDTKRP